MKLFYAPASPFVRKVNVLAIEAGLDTRLEWVKTNPWQAEEILIAENPLSQIPTLITDDGQVIYDSRVICEYLDTLHTENRFIPLNENRWPVLRLQALADGILNAGILRFREAKRETALQSADWDQMQKNAIERGLDYLESSVSQWRDDLNVGVITVGCTLGWLDFRFSNEDWRLQRPDLSHWYQVFSTRSSMLKTVPHD